MTTKELNGYRTFARDITVRAGERTQKNFPHAGKRKARLKKRHEVVTESDMEAHDMIRAAIQKRYPGHSFVSEEGGSIQQDSPYTWVVDPLDGTLNYTIGNPFFCSSVSLLENGFPILSVLYAPVLNELFIAQKGRTATLNNKKITISDERALSRSVMTFAYFQHNKKSRMHSLHLLQELEDRARGLRHLGCTSLELAYVACGRMEASIISPPLRLWDVAAGMLLIQTAGGRLSDIHGAPIEQTINLQKGLIASNGSVHSRIVQLLKNR